MTKKSNPDPNSLPSLSRVFGYIAVKELSRVEDKVRVLAQLGYGNEEIAAVCGTSNATVRTLKSKVLKSGGEKKKKAATKNKTKRSKRK